MIFLEISPAVRQNILIRTLAISAAKWLISIATIATPAAKRSILIG